MFHGFETFNIRKMSLTLGEKLRQAREERGISIMEVSEQTRISPLYLEAIENDDYSPLPGGIFNKGFVKTFAKYVGVDENEALQDYTRLVTQQTGSEDNVEPQTYRPEVLTDDRASSSNIITIVFAVVILGLMTWGVLALVSYIQDQQNAAPVVANTNSANTSANSNAAVNANAANTNAAAPIPATNEIKVEFKPLSETVSLEATVDGKKSSLNVAPDAPQTFTGQTSVRLRYYRGFADKVGLTINGKQITPPPAPARGNGIEFEINKENIVQILQSGQFSTAAPATNANANVAR